MKRFTRTICSVKGCGGKHLPFHRFPNPLTAPEKFKLWYSLCGEEQILKLEPKFIHSNLRVCHNHFEDSHLTVENRLVRCAFPTKNLPDPVNLEFDISEVYVPANGIDVPEVSHEVCTLEPSFSSVGAHDTDLLGIVIDVPKYEPLRIRAEPKQCKTPRDLTPLISIEDISEDAHGRGLPDLSLEVLNKLTVQCKRVATEHIASRPSPTKRHKQAAETDVVSDRNVDQAFQPEICILLPAKESDNLPADVSSGLKDRRNKPLLRLVGVTHQHDLTPTAKWLYKQVKMLYIKTLIWKKEPYSFKNRLKIAKKFAHSRLFLRIMQHLTPTFREYFLRQIKAASREKKNITHSLNDKVSATALYKQCPKGYSLLCEIFSLPSRSSLNKLLNKFRLPPGVCKSVFRRLKLQVPKMCPKDTCCILIFKEIPLRPHLHYVRCQDVVEGFIDNGHCRCPDVADRVQVFMLKGIFKQWLQPIAYIFGTSTLDTVSTYKEIVQEAHSVGLKVIASVCDNSANNAKALEVLREEAVKVGLWENKQTATICIEGNEVIPLFDSTNLLKTIRNNLLSKDLWYIENGYHKAAKWSHVEDCFFIDCSAKMRLLQKLTKQHIVPSKINKRKNLLCTQVFSRTVAAVLSLMSRCEIEEVDGSRKMAAEGQDTADLLYFFNQLFDSLNGGFELRSAANNNFRSVVSERSCHARFWNKAIKLIRSMMFVCCESGNYTKPAVLDYWISTIKGFRLVQKRLFELGYHSFSTRVFNVDVLDNLVRWVRQPDVQKLNNTCTDFVSFFKASLVNNFLTEYSESWRYESGNCQSVLVSLEQLIIKDVQQESVDVKNKILTFVAEDMGLNTPLKLTVMSYVNQFVEKNIFPIFKDCSVCVGNIFCSQEMFFNCNYSNVEQRFKSYSVKFALCITTVYNYIIFVLPYVLYFTDFTRNIKKLMCAFIEFEFNNCDHMNTLVYTITEEFTDFVVDIYCKDLNKILRQEEYHSNRNAGYVSDPNLT